MISSTSSLRLLRTWHRGSLALLVLLLGACGTQEPAPEQTLAGEHLNTEIPSGWVKVRDTRLQLLHVREYVPPDTTTEWNEKLSIEALGGQPLPDPLDFVQGWAADQAKLCVAFRDSPIFSGFENGYPTVVHLLECFQAKRNLKPVVTMVKVIQGNTSLYTITRIWRLPEPSAEQREAGELPLSPAAIAGWSDVLSRTSVCETDSSEHPCATATTESSEPATQS